MQNIDAIRHKRELFVGTFTERLLSSIRLHYGKASAEVIQTRLDSEVFKMYYRFTPTFISVAQAYGFELGPDRREELAYAVGLFLLLLREIDFEIDAEQACQIDQIESRFYDINDTDSRRWSTSLVAHELRQHGEKHGYFRVFISEFVDLMKAMKLEHYQSADNLNTFLSKRNQAADHLAQTNIAIMQPFVRKEHNSKLPRFEEYCRRYYTFGLSFDSLVDLKNDSILDISPRPTTFVKLIFLLRTILVGFRHLIDVLCLKPSYIPSVIILNIIAMNKIVYDSRTDS